MHYSKIFKEENMTVFTMWAFPSFKALEVWSGLNQVGQGAAYLLRVVKTPTKCVAILRCGVTGVLLNGDELDVSTTIAVAFQKVVELMKVESESENKEESWSLDSIYEYQKTHPSYDKVADLELDGEIYKDVRFCFIDEDTIQYIHPKRKDVCTTHYKSIVV